MNTVKRIFFLTEDEAKKLRGKLSDPYIITDAPHYELEDGTILYSKAGAPAEYERWVAPGGKNDKGEY